MGAETFHSSLIYILATWGAITIALIVLLIYRSQLTNREDDQIYLGRGEDTLAAEQRTIVARIDALARPIKVLYILSGALLIALVAVWLATMWAER